MNQPDLRGLKCRGAKKKRDGNPKFHSGSNSKLTNEKIVANKFALKYKHPNNMNTDIHHFMFEWGPLITASICLICGFVNAKIYSTGMPLQITVISLIVWLVMFACVISLSLQNIPSEKMLRGLFLQRILLGILVPLLAGVGLFAWFNPEKWAAIAEKRKYKKGFRK